jgi:ribosomal protein S18 acetylase RimI-like enzyme
MGITYRTLHEDEEVAAIDIWVGELGHDRTMIQRRWQTDPQYLDHTYAAIAPDGQVVAAISYFLRTVHDAAGTPQRLGHVFYVATRADFQGQGHGRELMARVTKAMQQAGCQWAAVSAGAQARGFYARTGWKLYDTPYRQGTVATEARPTQASYRISSYDPIAAPEGWAPLIPIYTIYNAGRPLTTVRDQAYWESWVAVIFQTWQHPPLVLLATREGASQPCGYVFAHFYAAGFVIMELGVVLAEAEAISSLLSAVADEAPRRGSPPRGRVYLPQEPVLDRALAQLFGSSLHAGGEPDSMLRPIADTMTQAEIDAIVSAPGAIRWSIDQV